MILVQDGRRGGHKKWTIEALGAGCVDGAIVSPWHTAKTTVADFVEAVREHGGTPYFDATTHAFMPGVDKFDLYDGWELWSDVRGRLIFKEDFDEHVRRVFGYQDFLDVQHITPTVALNSAMGDPVRAATLLAETGSAIDPDAWQSLAGSRPFWASGELLDQFVGELAHLKSPGWVLTFIRDKGVYPPDQSDRIAEAGFLRTVASLSLRSIVVIAHADLAGLPGAAAGALHIGSGWDAGQRVFSAEPFIVKPPGGQNIEHVTYEQLLGRTRLDQYEALERVDLAKAKAWLGVGGPVESVARREGHFRVLRDALRLVQSQSDLEGRVKEMRALFARASAKWNSFHQLVPGMIPLRESNLWHAPGAAALELFAEGENL